MKGSFVRCSCRIGPIHLNRRTRIDNWTFALGLIRLDEQRVLQTREARLIRRSASRRQQRSLLTLERELPAAPSLAWADALPPGEAAVDLLPEPGRTAALPHLHAGRQRHPLYSGPHRHPRHRAIGSDLPESTRLHHWSVAAAPRRGPAERIDFHTLRLWKPGSPAPAKPTRDRLSLAYFVAAAPLIRVDSFEVSLVYGTTTLANALCDSSTFLKKASFSSNRASTFFADLIHSGA